MIEMGLTLWESVAKSPSCGIINRFDVNSFVETLIRIRHFRERDRGGLYNLCFHS